jgi:hypothetical protein
MGSFGDFLENELLDHVFGNAAYSAPANLFFGLSTTDPLDDGSGITEPGGGSYARKSMANNATNFPAAVSGAKSNGTAITFVTATASWGVIGWVIIMDLASGGNMLAHAALDSSKTVDNGDTVEFAVGDLDITLD